jgi:hypothetical protein
MEVRRGPDCPRTLHATATATPTAITTPVAWIFHVVVVRRPSLLRHRLDTPKHSREPPMQVHRTATAAIRLGSLFSTLHVLPRSNPRNIPKVGDKSNATKEVHRRYLVNVPTV